MALRFIPAVGLFLIISLAASIAQAQKAFYVVGEAQKTCGNYISAVEGERRYTPKNYDPNLIYTNEYLDFVAVTEGFLSGANFEDASHRFVGAQTDSRSRMLWLENFCRSQPLTLFIGALIALRDELINQDK